MKQKLNRILTAWFLLCISVNAQDTLRIAVRPDSSVFLYHSIYLPPSYGFNIYRRAGSGEEKKLNEEPVKGAVSGGEFRTMIAGAFEELQAAFKESSAPEILASLRSRPVDARLYTFAYQEVARALGRVFVDHRVPLGSRVTYRIAVVDPFGNETGESHQITKQLNAHTIQPPSRPEYSNREDLVSLQWNYPVPAGGRDDYVIRFDVYRQLPTGKEERLNRGLIVRNEASEKQSFAFRAPVGEELNIVIRAVDITGQMGPPSPAIRIVLKDNVPPSPPTDVTASLLDRRIVEVTWPVSVEADAAAYHVYRAASADDNAPLNRLTTLPLGLLQTLFRDTTLPAMRGTWFYRVTAVDRSGNESKPSNAAMVMVEDQWAPATPTGLTAEFLRDRKVRLRWQSPERPSDFQTFIIMRKKLVRGSPDVPTRINSTDIRETHFLDEGEAGEGFQEGAVYRYWVSAADSTRNVSDSVWVDMVIPRLTPPSAPQGVSALNDRGIRVIVRWSELQPEGIVSFIVHRRTQGARDTTRTLVPGDKREYRDESVSSPATYIYWVSALDSSGYESAPSVRDTVMVRDFTPPRAVRNIRAEATNNGITVTWEPVPESIAGYRVFRAPIATGSYVEITRSLTRETRWVDREGKPGDWYRVQVYDLSGNESAPARPAQATKRSGR